MSPLTRVVLDLATVHGRLEGMAVTAKWAATELLQHELEAVAEQVAVIKGNVAEQARLQRTGGTVA